MGRKITESGVTVESTYKIQITQFSIVIIEYFQVEFSFFYWKILFVCNELRCFVIFVLNLLFYDFYSFLFILNLE